MAAYICLVEDLGVALLHNLAGHHVPHLLQKVRSVDGALVHYHGYKVCDLQCCGLGIALTDGHIVGVASHPHLVYAAQLPVRVRNKARNLTGQVYSSLFSQPHHPGILLDFFRPKMVAADFPEVDIAGFHKGI